MNEANSDKGASGPIRGCIAEVIKAARAAPAIYFAPLVGAFTGVALQWKKLQPQPLAKPKPA